MPSLRGDATQSVLVFDARWLADGRAHEQLIHSLVQFFPQYRVISGVTADAVGDGDLWQICSSGVMTVESYPCFVLFDPDLQGNGDPFWGLILLRRLVAERTLRDTPIVVVTDCVLSREDEVYVSDVAAGRFSWAALQRRGTTSFAFSAIFTLDAAFDL
ncbi:MAG: hypothetical protein KC925_02235 [Candidatus Doudnabacteria bacterium]|nr:hypothetical protein [Candidatus Doudnabacteria bacterium]